MSPEVKSSKCVECGHIFEYALWQSSCPNCRSSNLQVVNAAPPVKEKQAIKLVTDTVVRDPNRPPPKSRLIHNDDSRESHFVMPEGGVPLIIDEESRPKPKTLLTEDVKLILDADSTPHTSQFAEGEIDLLIMELEDQYRFQEGDNTESAPSPEEKGRYALERRLERLRAMKASQEQEDAEENAPARQARPIHNPTEEAPPRGLSRGGSEEAPPRGLSRGGSVEAPPTGLSRGGSEEAPPTGLSRGGSEVAPRTGLSRGGSEEAPRTGLSRGGSEVAPPTGLSRGGSEEAPRTGLSRGRSEEAPRTGLSRGGSEEAPRTGLSR
ncbi:MAG: hypothetical protein R3Y63_03975, partial [Eubacteriales bacterium]